MSKRQIEWELFWEQWTKDGNKVTGKKVVLTTNLDPSHKVIVQIEALMKREGWRLEHRVDMHNATQIFPCPT